jgi:hypothetical protein
MDLKWTITRKFGAGTQLLMIMCLMHSLFHHQYSVHSFPQNLKSSITSETNTDGKDESEAKLLTEMLDKVFTSGMNKEMTARWNYIVNITDENEISQVSRPIILGTNLEQIIELSQCFNFTNKMNSLVFFVLTRVWGLM